MSSDEALCGKLAKRRQHYYNRLENTYGIAIAAQTDATKIPELKSRIEDLFNCCSSFESLQLDILGLAKEADHISHYAVASKFDSMKYAISSIARDLISPSDTNTGKMCNQSNAGVSDPSDSLDLPRINVPTFSGNRRDWPTFIDLFNSLVHEKKSLSDVQRFQHLSMALQGDAASVIKNIPLTDANYVVAYNALTERFDNKRALATDYWLAIYQCQPAKANNAGDLRNVLSTFSQNMEALSHVKGIDLWDFTKLNLLLQKIDSSLKTRFEIECSSKAVPKYSDLTAFLGKTCKALENSVLLNQPSVSNQYQNNSKVNSENRQKRVNSVRSFVTSTQPPNCGFCKTGPHLLIKCEKFLASDIPERHEFVKNERMCFNCFSKAHSVFTCDKTQFCKICSKKHNTLLHFVSKQNSSQNGETSQNTNSRDPLLGQSSMRDSHRDNVNPCFASTTLNVGCHIHSSSKPSSVLFATAEVSVCSADGNLVNCRALLDCASQASFISRDCVTRLGLPITAGNNPIQGINNMSTTSSIGTVHLQVSPKDNDSPNINLRAIVLPSICATTPTSVVSIARFRYLKNLELADSNFGQPGGVDLLLGVDIFAEVIVPGLKKSINGGPCAIKTIFGWVLLGTSSEPSDFTSEFISLCTSIPSVVDSEDFKLQNFWELECVPHKIPLAPEDQRCEDHFLSTHARTSDGRYIVRLPFRDVATLGDSRKVALRRFTLLESRLNKQPGLHKLYCDFMRDYLDQGHMQLCTEIEIPNYYFPHHCVIKYDKESPKIRVVFDGSSKSSNGSSLNDVLFVGPKLQNDIVQILLSFRYFPIVLSADIRQMYRNIVVDPRDVQYQKILWRFDTSSPIQEYNLCTVTYGLNCSPYLAIRTLHQLAKDHGHSYPLAADTLLHSTYVDDIVGFTSSVEQALELQRQLIGLMQCGCFELRKWTSNCRELLTCVPESHQQNISFSDNDNSVLKILGLQWNPVVDAFSYSVRPISRECTKRVILSEIAKIYDPLGFLAPVVLVAKCLIQRLWLQGLEWDETPCQDILNQWQTYASQLPLLSEISIPRCATISDPVVTELHGFSDASLIAYGGVVYIRQINSEGQISVSLLCAKSKVCPLKIVSIPRLELCAALLLAHLMQYVVSTSPIRFNQIYAWSDSSVALFWIKNHPSQYRPFVANRVTQIQELVPPNRWFHVSGAENPADCLSRSLLPRQLIDHSMWFTGSPWLKTSCDLWPPSSVEFNPAQNPAVQREQRNIVCTMVIVSNQIILSLLERFSSLKTIQSIIAYCIRFLNVCSKKCHAPESKSLSASELYTSLCVIVKGVQLECFPDDRRSLENKTPCSKPLRKLAPFLDQGGVIRVGGRLRHSNLPFDAKHPLLLPKNHRLTILVIESVHNQYGHPGPRLLQCLIRQQFWILSINRAIHSVLSRCFRCTRVNPVPYSPFMGDLPKVRVSQVKAFSHCGVDYMGPIPITISKRRGIQSQKGYVCLFVCMATKALHLEAASDLTSEAFLAAFRRFVARRGRCLDMYSDQGTNFVGANRLLLSYSQNSAEHLSIRWHFNPPSAPHFGGLWESSVKSVKSHLSRVIGQQVLSFEEVSTVLAQCEAILNSRPLCSLSPDPNDLECLTPGHFLTFEALNAPPDEDLTDVSIGRLKRWQLVQQMGQNLWKKWYIEYLHTLQQRNKWNIPNNLPIVGSLVVLKEDNQPPLKWILGRITKIYGSPDKIPRVVQVRTAKGFLDRPLVKVCPLPSS